MTIETCERYKEQLLRMKPNVYLNGEHVGRSNGKEGEGGDLADWIRGGTYVMKQCYDVVNNPKYEDVCVTMSRINGERINHYTHIYHGMDDLLKKQLMAHLTCQHVGGCMQCCTGTDAMNVPYLVTYDYGETYGTEYRKRLLAYIEYCQKYDLICNYVQTDIKGSHNPKYKRAHMQPDPGSFAHVVETGVDGTGVDDKPYKGIIMRDTKICSSRAPYVDEITVDPTKFMSQNDSDYVVAFALPADWDGVKLMVLSGLHHKRAYLDTPHAQIEDAESSTIFDGCLMPYDRVSMCGRDHEGTAYYADYLALMFTRYHRYSYAGCKTVISEVIVPQTAPVADVNDIARGSHVRGKTHDIIQTAELVFVVGKAAAYRTIEFPSDQWVSDKVPTGARRRLAGHNMYCEYGALTDLTGGIYVPLLIGEGFSILETAELCSKYIRRNPAYSAEDTCRVIRMMENKLRDSHEVVQAVAGVHGGGSLLMETITLMSRYDLEELRKIAKYLTGTPGCGKCPHYEHSAHAATPRVMFVRFDVASPKKKNK